MVANSEHVSCSQTSSSSILDVLHLPDHSMPSSAAAIFHGRRVDTFSGLGFSTGSDGTRL